VTRALASLRVFRGENVPLPLALMQQCAATLTELECFDLEATGYWSGGRVLPRCTRLESLTLIDWSCCPPSSWLGLSQLHTLRGVSLCDVPAATIAAALPRLHTLHVHHANSDDVDFPVAAFYHELLPRLRSFHLEGPWPDTRDETEATDVPALRLLEDLKWSSEEVRLPRQLMAARPSTLNISDVDLVEWLTAEDGASADSSTATLPLDRVRALTLRLEGETSPEAAFMAQLLRGAPHLRRLTFHTYGWAHLSWVLSDEFTSEQGLVHPRLRHVAFTSECVLDGSSPGGCGARLRQRHFPRLRRLTVAEEEYPV
jgi:hypothetical protein